ncbi:MAG: MbcA/ParS/Xre antitoxin family protein [Kiloniellales bacterium]|nr:MbcA/ParS/Xre antitoxin family protein [Kiloniellales bacterium]
MVEFHIVEQVAPPRVPGFSNEEERAMQRAVIALFERWGLTDAEASILLGDISARTFQRWKQGQLGRVSNDLAARLSNLMGIHKALRLLFAEKERGYGWIKRPNAALGGKSALDVMLGGQLTDLMRVRRYLDTQRSPW